MKNSCFLSFSDRFLTFSLLSGDRHHGQGTVLRHHRVNAMEIQSMYFVIEDYLRVLIFYFYIMHLPASSLNIYANAEVNRRVILPQAGLE